MATISFDQFVKKAGGTSKDVSVVSPAPKALGIGGVTTPQTTNSGVSVGTLLNPTVEGISGLKTLYGGGEQGIANKLKSSTQRAIEAQRQSESGEINPLVAGGKIAAEVGRTTGDLAGAVYASVGAVIGATGLGKVFEGIGKLSQMGGKYNILNGITDMKLIQDFVA